MSAKLQERGNIRVALVSAIWYVISNFLVKAMSFITIPIFTRIMPKADYGDFTSFCSWQQIILIIAGAELYATVNRAYYDYKDDFNEYLSSITVLGLLVGTIIYGVFLIFSEQVCALLMIRESFIHNIYAYCVTVTAFYIFQAYHRVLYKYKLVAMLSAFQLFSATTMAVIMVLNAEDKLNARVWGQFIPTMIIGALCGIYLIVKGKRVRLSCWKYALAISLPLVLHYLSFYALSSTNIILVKRFFDADTAAIVSVAVSCQNILVILIQALGNAFSPWIMDKLNEGKESAVRSFTTIFLTAFSAAVVMLMLVGPELVAILGGAEYAASAYLIPPLVCASMLQMISTLMVIVLTYEKKTKSLSFVTLGAAAVSVGLKVLMLSRFAYGTAPYADIVGFIIVVAFDYGFICKLGRSKVFNIKAISIIILAGIAMLAASLFLYAHTILRWCIAGALLVAIAFFAFRYRTLLMSFLRKKKA